MIISKLSKANKSLLNSEINELDLSSQSIKRKMIPKENRGFFNIADNYLQLIKKRKQFHQFEIELKRIEVFKKLCR